jgi:hypothetical protein
MSTLLRDFRLIDGGLSNGGFDEDGVLSHPIPAECCGTCIFFNSITDQCRRFPKTEDKMQYDWCGEFDMKIIN